MKLVKHECFITLFIVSIIENISVHDLAKWSPPLRGNVIELVNILAP